MQLVIFDMDGTLYRFKDSGTDGIIFKTPFYEEVKQNGIRFIAKSLSISDKEAEGIREAIFRKYNSDVSRGLEIEFKIAREEYFSNVWNINPAPYVAYDKGLKTTLSAIPLKKAVLTSAPEVWARSVLKWLKVDELFEGEWFGNGDIRKPAKEAFTQVTKSFGISASDTCMVDDEPKSLIRAKELGMTTILRGSFKAPYIDLNIREICEIKEVMRGRLNEKATTLKVR